MLRRLRRLPRIALFLSTAACSRPGAKTPVHSVFFGTGWGALSETHAFLNALFASGERLSSPTDFIGSVHNAPAGQIALDLGAAGANVTMTGGDASFEQALFAAGSLAGAGGGNLLVVGADEYHPVFSPLFDASFAGDDLPADGGGALCLSTDPRACGPGIESVFLRPAASGTATVADLVETLGGAGAVSRGVGALLAGIPRGMRPDGFGQLKAFLDLTGFGGPVVDYRKYTGEFAAASAVAAAVAARWAACGQIPAALCAGRPAALEGKAILLMGFGDIITAVTVKGRQ